MDGYDGRWIHSNPPFLNLHLTWELQSEVRESRVPGPGTHLVINQKQSKRTTLQWNQHSINLSLPQLAYPYPVALVTLRKVARIECMNPHLTVLTPFEVNVERWTIVLFDRDLVWGDVNRDVINTIPWELYIQKKIQFGFICLLRLFARVLQSNKKKALSGDPYKAQ